jgi:HD superfamily phosphohydrolase
MADLTRPGRVRDPVHGYVLFTGLEREILDHPVAQRLRHVSQSGMAQLVFPEVRSTRFSHSLGAMHLASRFFSTALRNASSETQGDTQERLKAAVLAQLGAGMSQEARARAEEELNRQGLRAGGSVADEFRPYALLVEQGLRLAALFHDLGHLPFSHDFEYALQAALRRHVQHGGDRLPTLGAVSRLAIHEAIGYKLATLLQHQIFGQLEPPQKWVEVSFLLAENILHARTELDPDREPGLGGPGDSTEGLYQWLHSFVAGELDVDRCDYVLRDTRHYGFEFASFDLDRLVDNVVTCRSRKVPDALFNAVLPQGQSALESFLLARYRMYQWGIFHHKVQQAAAALQKVTRDVLTDALRSEEHPLSQFLEDVEAIAAAGNPEDFLDERADVLQRFAGYDDVWWMTLLRERARTRLDDPWLQLVCRRRHGPYSLWKRRLDFPNHTDIAGFNRALPGSSDEDQVAWQAAVDKLEEEGVLVLRHRFQPWKRKSETDPTSALSVRQPNGDTIALSELSHLIHGLLESWMNEVQVQAFSERKDMIAAEEVVARLSQTTAGSEAQ